MKLHPTETHLLGMIGFYENLIHFNAFSFLSLLFKFNLSTKAITRYRYQFFLSLSLSLHYLKMSMWRKNWNQKQPTDFQFIFRPIIYQKLHPPI